MPGTAPEEDARHLEEGGSVSIAARYRILHETHYRYTAPVSLSQQHLHLTPRTTARQTVLDHDIQVSPYPAEQSWHLDYFGNTTLNFEIRSPHMELLVRVDSTASVTPPPAEWVSTSGPDWQQVAQLLRGLPPTTPLEPTLYAYDSPQVAAFPALTDYGRESFPPGTGLLDGARHLTRRIFRDFSFDPEATTVATPLAQVLEQRRGVCQDFAHLMIAALRGLGLSARYVSGYLLTTPPPGQPRMIGADASHAWVALWCPEIGWVEFDPTNNCQPRDQHIVLGWGRDFSDVTPMRGVILGGGGQELEARVTVLPEGSPEALALQAPPRVQTQKQA